MKSNDMPVGRLDHYSIRTLDVEASRRFYTIELNYPAAEIRKA